MEHPRDHVGYGAERPRFEWPGGARVALNFCLNYEEGGERNVLDGDDRSEDRICDVAVTPRVGRRDLNAEQSYEYGARVGYWRMLRAFEARGLPATVNLVGAAAERNPHAIRAMVAAGMDVQLHGWRWLDHDGTPEEAERADLARAIAQAEAIAGERPAGVYMGMPSMNSRRLAAEAGLLYQSDVYNDDLPYWAPDHPGLLLMPYSLDTNDSRFARTNGGYQIAAEFAAYVADGLDVLLSEPGPSMMTVGLHARLIGRPSRFAAVHRILDDAMAREGVWIARRDDVARAFAERMPPP